MIAGLKPYPAMKDSGVRWLGDVPAHWDVEPIARIGRLSKGNGGSKEDEVASGVPCVRYGDLYTRHEFFVRATKACVSPERATSYTSIRSGDLLFAASGETVEDIGRSAVNLIQGEACCGGDILVLRPDRLVNAAYLGYAADAMPSRHQKASMGRGFTVVHVYASQLKRLALPLPPLPEQAAIVRILDHVDRRIRRYIRAKQKLIKLLEEQKQAIIHRAVTRGLDPNVRLKPSGVQWLGDMPEQWEISPIKRLLLRMDYGTSEVAKPDGKVRVLTMGNIQEGEVVAAGSGGLYEVPNGLLLEEHDLLFTRTNGNPDLVGKVGLFRGSARDQVTFASYLVRLRVLQPFHAQWLHFLLNSTHFWAFARSHALVNLQTNLNSTRYGQFLVPVPPPAEQKAIVEWIECETRQSVKARTVAQREIALLREYRTRLIADVVTGKLDVREAAAGLPDEAEDFDELVKADSDLEDEPEEDADVETVNEEAEG